MKQSVKEKVTVSLDANILGAVDRRVRAHPGYSRSAIVEEALRLWGFRQKQEAIEKWIESYYRSSSPEEKEENQDWASLSGPNALSFWND
jgi:Arc/MetJ-type ribon-helix-helix transcriptional regulator